MKPNPERVSERSHNAAILGQGLPTSRLLDEGPSPYLSDHVLRGETHAYLAGACRDLGSPSLIVGGVADHVHILCYMSRTLTMADLVAEIKRESSKWIKAKGATLSDFYWQSGYGIFSISPGHVDKLREYIANQESHHRHESFQDEYRRLLEKYGAEYGERYVWD